MVRDISERVEIAERADLLGDILRQAATEIYVVAEEPLEFLFVSQGAAQNLGYSPSELRRMPVVTPMGVSVPLDNVADVDVGLGPDDITRLDQERITRLECLAVPNADHFETVDVLADEKSELFVRAMEYFTR